LGGDGERKLELSGGKGRPEELWLTPDGMVDLTRRGDWFWTPWAKENLRQEKNPEKGTLYRAMGGPQGRKLKIEEGGGFGEGAPSYRPNSSLPYMFERKGVVKEIPSRRARRIQSKMTGGNREQCRRGNLKNLGLDRHQSEKDQKGNM